MKMLKAIYPHGGPARKQHLVASQVFCLLRGYGTDAAGDVTLQQEVVAWCKN